MKTMAKHVYDKIVTLQVYSEDIDGYTDVTGIPPLHAHVNSAMFTTEKYEGRAMPDDVTMDFYFRYQSFLKPIVKRPQLYRLLWDGDAYDVVGGDNFQMQNKEIRLRGVIANGGR